VFSLLKQQKLGNPATWIWQQDGTKNSFGVVSLFLRAASQLTAEHKTSHWVPQYLLSFGSQVLN